MSPFIIGHNCPLLIGLPFVYSVEHVRDLLLRAKHLSVAATTRLQLATGFMDIDSHWRTKLRRELPLRFFVVFVATQDLLLRAKHLLERRPHPMVTVRSWRRWSRRGRGLAPPGAGRSILVGGLCNDISIARAF
jgi:hypothetical protein